MQQTEVFSQAFREWTEIFMGRSMHRFMQQAKEAGLSMPQIATLMRIHRHGALPVSDISKDMGTTLAATSQMLDRLVLQGLITRSEDPKDRRVRKMALTAGKTEDPRQIGAGKGPAAPAEPAVDELKAAEIDAQLEELKKKLSST